MLDAFTDPRHMSRKTCTKRLYPTNTPYVFYVETTWKRSFQTLFNVEFTWYVCTLQILGSRYKKKNTQNEHIIAHFEYFFTCHYSKTVWLAENLNEVKITHYEKIFSHIKQTFSHFEKGLGNVLKEDIFLSY